MLAAPRSQDGSLSLQRQEGALYILRALASAALQAVCLHAHSAGETEQVETLCGS